MVAARRPARGLTRSLDYYTLPHRIGSGQFQEPAERRKGVSCREFQMHAL